MRSIPSIPKINGLFGGVSSSGISLDSDAAAYIAAVVAAGGTVSDTQRTVINTFYKTGKADGWYSSLKRMYLPIWGVAAPNAIDLVTRTSGTFVGGVTHSAGFVQNDGATGYFITDGTVASIGCTLNGTGVFSLMTAESAVAGFSGPLFGSRGASVASTIRLSGGFDGINNSFAISGHNSLANSQFHNGIGTDQRAIVHILRINNTNVVGLTRKTAGTTNTLLNNVSSSLNSTRPMAFMASNASPILSYLESRLQNGAWGMTEGFTVAQSENFTLALKNLWETSTGLTLP